MNAAVERRIRVGDWLVPYDDADQEVVVERTLADILSATPGDAAECMNSRCIRAQRNRHVFPHPVYAVSTIKTRVYIIDQLDDGGEPAHAVRYELTERDRKLIDAHDKHGEGETGELRLRIPYDPKGSPRRKAAAAAGRFEGGGRYSGTGKHTRNTRPLPLGQKRRLVAAVGLNKPKD